MDDLQMRAADEVAVARRLPLLRTPLLIAAAVLLTLLIALFFALYPYYRTSKLIEQIDRLGGTAQLSLDTPPYWAAKYLPTSLSSRMRSLDFVVLLSPSVDDDFADRVSHESRLETLFLYAPRITARGLWSLQRRLPSLKNLVLLDADEISPAAVAQFRSERPGVNLVKAGPAYLGIQWHDTDLFVTTTDPGSPAELAGLKAGDEINELDGLKLKDTHGLVAAIAAYRPGDRIRLKFIRNSVEREVQVTLGKRKKPPTDIDAICY